MKKKNQKSHPLTAKMTKSNKNNIHLVDRWCQPILIRKQNKVWEKEKT